MLIMLKPIKRRMLILLSLVFVLLASCGGEVPTEVPMDLNEILTAGVGTLAASIFETQTALVPPVTETAVVTPSITNTPLSLPTTGPSATQGFVFLPNTNFTASPTGTLFTPTPNPSSLAFGCNNLGLIRDETIPAGTVMRPGETFTKIWKVENNGTCNWMFLYRLVFVGGNQMGGDPAGLARVIQPPRWTQISIALTAPNQPGTHTGSWRLGDQAGNAFGSTLVVSIVVANPTNTPQPTLTHTPVTPSNTPAPTNTPTETYTPTLSPTP